MYTDWKTPYQVAMREQNDTKFKELYEQARHAIHSRSLQLGGGAFDIRERREMDEALRQLAIRKYKVKMVS